MQPCSLTFELSLALGGSDALNVSDAIVGGSSEAKEGEAGLTGVG